MTSTRRAVQAAVDDYFSGKISVDEAFRRAYGPDTRKSASAIRMEKTADRHRTVQPASGKRHRKS